MSGLRQALPFLRPLLLALLVTFVIMVALPQLLQASAGPITP